MAVGGGLATAGIRRADDKRLAVAHAPAIEGRDQPDLVRGVAILVDDTAIRPCPTAPPPPSDCQAPLISITLLMRRRRKPHRDRGRSRISAGHSIAGKVYQGPEGRAASRSADHGRRRQKGRRLDHDGLARPQGRQPGLAADARKNPRCRQRARLRARPGRRQPVVAQDRLHRGHRSLDQQLQFRRHRARHYRPARAHRPAAAARLYRLLRREGGKAGRGHAAPAPGRRHPDRRLAHRAHAPHAEKRRRAGGRDLGSSGPTRSTRWSASPTRRPCGC